MRPFREHHVANFLDEWGSEKGALDASLALYFRKHKSIGSKDRQEIADKIYKLIRWKRLPEGSDPFDTSLPFPVRVSVPDELWEAFNRSYGEERAFHLLYESNFAAPTTVRINPAKTTRDALFEKWKSIYDVSLASVAPYGIVFHKKITFFNLDEYKEGLFEVQDEASQLVGNLIDPKPGDRILDYCSGSGGKTLAFAHKTAGKGQIYLHDIRKKILIEAKKRLKRAGVQNAQFLNADEEAKLAPLKKKMDWVLVDAPCSGTGTLRRNPDMKYRFTEEGLKKLVGEQRTIFEKALSFVKPGGKIVWATCSLLKEENEEQVAHFLKTYPLTLVAPPFASHPERGEMDGLFAAIFIKADN